MRPTLCEINLDAISANVATLRAHVSPTPLCAVVKADGYGHGAVPVARAALEGGAEWLAVALVEEGIELRQGGIGAPILVLSEPLIAALPLVVDYRLTPTVYRLGTIEALGEVAASRGPVAVHIGVDSGMRRVGVKLDELANLAAAANEHDALRLEAIWTHLPVADEPDNPFTADQLKSFDAAVANAAPTHVANSAAAITRPDADAFMVRCGISIYGIEPAPEVAGQIELVPAMTLRSQVSFVKAIEAGQGVGYGHRFHAATDTTIATVPIGYADGVRRDFGLRGGSVLIGGTPYPVVGVVTMDQLMVDVGSADISVGDDVVLLGRQGNSEQSAESIAAVLDTIPYEVVCAVSKRVPRVYS